MRVNGSLGKQIHISCVLPKLVIAGNCAEWPLMIHNRLRARMPFREEQPPPGMGEEVLKTPWLVVCRENACRYWDTQLRGKHSGVCLVLSIKDNKIYKKKSITLIFGHRWSQMLLCCSSVVLQYMHTDNGGTSTHTKTQNADCTYCFPLKYYFPSHCKKPSHNG